MSRAAAARACVAALMVSTSDDEGSNEWYTPLKILAPARAMVAPNITRDTPARDRGRIGLDPFWGPGCVTSPIIGVTEAMDGFKQDWRRLVERANQEHGGRAMIGAPGVLDVFANPPYGGGAMTRIATKIPAEFDRGLEIVSLFKANTAENWFDVLVWQTATSVCFVRGRVTFEAGPGATPQTTGNTAQFSSVVCYHGRRPDRFYDCFERIGHVINLR